MSEWKELEINNLPNDIMTGDYEIHIVRGEWEPESNNDKKLKSIVNDVLKKESLLPLAPTYDALRGKCVADCMPDIYCGITCFDVKYIYRKIKE